MARFGRSIPVPRRREYVPGTVILSASGNISATFGASSTLTITAYTAGSVAATFAAVGAPIGIYPAAGNVSGAFAASGAVAQQVVGAGTLTVTFAAASVSSSIVVQQYSTQPGNPWIVSVESYSFQLQHRIWGGVGVPTANLGTDGDYYFRKDGSPGARMYARASGSWSAIN